MPPPIRRTIHRVSALLETVDLEFERVLSERADYRATLTPDADRRLNADVLEALLDTLLPRANKEGFEAYSLLLWELKNLGITTTGQLTSVIQKHLPKVIEHDRSSGSNASADRAEDPRAAAGVYFSHAGLIRLILEEEFGQDYYSRIWEKAEAEEDA